MKLAGEGQGALRRLVSTSQDGGLAVKQRPPLKHVAVEVRQNLTGM